LGWMAAVASDFGIQLHVARAVSRQPERASAVFDQWLRVRWVTAAAALLIAGGSAALAPSTREYALPITILSLLYVCSGLVEFLHYVYRGLSRSDIESRLTLWQRAGTLVCGVLALAWRPDVSVLAIAMLVPVVATLIVSVGLARSLSRALSCETGQSASGIRSQRVSVTTAFRRDVWPIGAGIVLSATYFRVDVFLVQRWSGTEAVGLYNAVFRLVDALRLFPAAVMAVAPPRFGPPRESPPRRRSAAARAHGGASYTVSGGGRGGPVGKCGRPDSGVISGKIRSSRSRIPHPAARVSPDGAEHGADASARGVGWPARVRRPVR